jgi:hypothetical protein
MRVARRRRDQGADLFKTYVIRAKLGIDWDKGIAYRIGRGVLPCAGGPAGGARA